MELSFDDEAVGAPPVDRICRLPQLWQVRAKQAAHIRAGTLELNPESGLLPHSTHSHHHFLHKVADLGVAPWSEDWGHWGLLA